MRVNENDDGSYSLFVSRKVSAVVKHHFPELGDASPKGWTPGNSDTEYVWIPRDRVDRIDLDGIKQWAEFAGNQCVWLGRGKPIESHFTGSELYYCIAGDFNFAIDEKDKISCRSKLGEAEYKLKYHLPELSRESKQQYCASMSQSLLETFDLLPLVPNAPVSSTVISSIPAREGSSRLAVVFAKHVADSKGCVFIEPRLLAAKPQMKGLGIKQKVAAWEKIYETANPLKLENASVQGRGVVIIDDLYQSGVTMWSYARALKAAGATHVSGLVCVKSMRDSDNR